MTYSDISRKMLSANFSRYRICFLCSLSAAALFFCFAFLYTNESFMNGEIVDPLISSNVYFPSILSALFLIFFLPVSIRVFFASRKREYGILFSLGMSRKEAFWKLLLESAVTAGLALAAALAVGTVLSMLFFAVIQYGLGIEGIRWRLSLEPYKMTILLYGAAAVPASVLSAGAFLREKIGIMLKEQYRIEKAGLCYRMLCRLSPQYMKIHMAEWAFLRRHNKEWGIRSAAAVFLAACSVMLVSICVTMYPAFLKDAENYSPYDMVYSEIYGWNRTSEVKAEMILEENLEKILQERGTAVRQTVKLPYIRNAVFNFVSAEDVNRSFYCDYHIEEGQFLNLFQYDLEDGYEHDLQPVLSAVYNGDDMLYSIGSDVRILWNQNPAFADRTLIVNRADFEKIKEDADCQTGVAHLFLFERWEDSYNGVRAVKEYLKGENQSDESIYVSSKIESILEAKKSGQFLLFLMSFIIALMMTAEFLLIHFRIQAEAEENTRAVKSLRLIGMADWEIMKCLKYKNFLRFLTPIILGTALSFLPSYYWNEMYGGGFTGIFIGIVFGAVTAAAEIFFLNRYSKKELRNYL